MKNLADIKRRCVVGAKLQLVAHADPRVALPIDREVLAVQSNAIKMTPWPGKANPSWLYWPRAADIRIEGADTFSVLEDGVSLLTYRFV